jgi:hypothetical protein
LTGFAVGYIYDLSYDGFIDYSKMFGHAPGTDMAWFEDQIAISWGSLAGNVFAEGGDSGSLVLDAMTLQPIGLFFAYNGNISFCNKIHRVMSALGILRV